MKEQLSDKNIRIEYLPCINYAMSVNGAKYLGTCELTNDDDCDWRELTVSLSGEFLASSETVLDLIPQGQTVTIGGLAIKPDVEKLRKLTESVETTFTLQVSNGERVLLSSSHPVRLMAIDEWPGISVMPELTAAFVTPNAPETAQVRINAAKQLERLTGSSSLDEYQTQDPNRVRAQVASVYEALRDESLVYCAPPASFEKSGQRIRLMSQLLTQKLGTCADLSLAFATCLESMGLHPLLIISEGHMFVGCWLVDKYYPQTIFDDVSFLTKSIADGINEIVVVEATCLTMKNMPFEKAVSEAEKHLYQTPDEFIMAIDVYRCRLDGIRPLPLKNNDDQSEGITLDHATDSIKEQRQYDLQTDGNRQLTRQQIWERKLLDFSLRNNLLNARIGKKLVPFISFDIDLIEDQLQAKEDFQILPIPTDQKILPDETGIYNSKAHTETLEPLVKEAVKHHQLYSYWDSDDLVTALTGLFRTSRTALEENGANTLFLTLGMLKWYETDKSVKPRYAPLLLEPVDIVKKSGKNYILRVREEDLTFNTTLVEMMQQQYDIHITGVNPLPMDESGADVRQVFSIVRAAVKDHPRWDVVEECMLGIFSFNKFVMWNDIHNNADKMRQNPIIESLIQKRLVDITESGETDTRAIDSTIAPGSYAIPVDVDSSQLEAVVESGEGRSFILYGPPGTGKSQTITNMIANALYHNRRVLFVAEKMAALEVVQRRLAKIGLEPFCLEMHSNKMTKSHLLQQLQKALDITRIKTPEEYAQESKALFDQRQRLIKQINLLHVHQPSGLSLYDYITRYVGIDYDEAIAPAAEMTAGIDVNRINSAERWVKELDAVFQITGHPSTHPLNGLRITDPSYDTQQKIQQLLQKMTPLVPEAAATIKSLSDCNGLTIAPSLRGAAWAERLVSLVKEIPQVNSDILKVVSDATQLQRWKSLIALGKERDSLAAGLAKEYTLEILQADVMKLKADWTVACDKWVVSRFFAKKKVVNSLKGYRRDISEEHIESLLNRLQEYRRKAAQVAESKDEAQRLFGQMGVSGKEQWAQIETYLDKAQTLQAMVRDTGTPAAYIPAINSAATLQTDMRAVSQLTALVREGASAVIFDPSLTLNDISERLPEWLSNIDLSRDWAQWCTRKKQMADNHLDGVVSYIESGHSVEEAHQAMLRGLYKKLAMEVIDGNKDLQMFNGMIFEDMIEKYRDMAKQFQELTKKALYCKLASSIPSLTIEAASGSEVGILKRYIASGGRGATIRHIIDQIPTLLPKLCPCILMSPISVAQFIDLDQDKFDLVVFDEASQMPTSEAIGAIARGKALIVVGDPKQMPPTSFFTSTQVDENEADNDDMESILDDCITLSFPHHYLTWHYRSRHESLIAFSNSQYYDGKLYTFPSVDDRSTKVRFVPIDGTYDMGKTRSNRAEAEAIVKEVVRRLSDDELSKQSIGVVSFSKVQQDLIEDILVDELSKQPELEKRAYDCAEPIFIKNLENVQGDERDIILFSVGYGPDKSGKVSMNFGPLNNQGGERRLNVAVSRARNEMIVFSTLRPEQIDLNRSRARGVEGLKRFLEFAKSGRMSVAASQIEEQTETTLIDSIAEKLRQKGFQVDTLVGRSRFKIDLAVIDPEDKDGYILGIMCDGKNYFNTRTERDREIGQPGVLKGLGWNLIRVWTIDWFMNRETVLERILKRIESIQNTRKSKQQEAAKPQTKSAQLKSAPKASAKSEPETAARTLAQAVPFEVAEDEIITEITNENEEEYQPKHFSPCYDYYWPRLFQTARRTMTNSIKAVIHQEQPVTLNTICKRIAELFSQSRALRIQDEVKALADTIAYRDPHSPTLNPYYWESAEAAQGYNKYRKSNGRDIDEIPLIEIKNVIRLAVRQQLAVPVEDLKRVIVKVLGYTRRTPKIDEAITHAVQQLVSEKVLVMEDGQVKVVE
ncbi:MAG: DUF4011 domain-containing protein [Prevotella sp.]|nr:DUF4011 domain-containing protein [Prevotella sp.]